MSQKIDESGYMKTWLDAAVRREHYKAATHQARLQQTRICTGSRRNLHRGRSHAPKDMATVVAVTVAAEIHIVAAPAGVATIPQSPMPRSSLPSTQAPQAPPPGQAPTTEPGSSRSTGHVLQPRGTQRDSQQSLQGGEGGTRQLETVHRRQPE